MVRLGTLAVHAGEQSHASGAINTPIVASTTYRYPEAADGSRAEYIYSRYDNPTVQALEQKVAALEGAAHGLAFASGMAAIAALCHTYLRPGDTIAVMEGVYGGTTAYLERELAPMGIRVVRINAFADATLPEGTRMVWLESISNPLLRVPDISSWARRAHDADALLAVDATFAGPVLHQPLALGADFSIHSATKTLGGHGDVTAGILLTNQDPEAIWVTRRNHGATLDPHTASLTMRGIKTLHLRVKAQSEAALDLAQRLSEHAAVAAVHYPGLERHAEHEHAAASMGGLYGCVVTIDVGSLEAAVSFRRAIQVITPAASLGGVESLASLPVETSHAYASADERAALGITPGLVRLSIGVEHVDDLWADLGQALHASGTA